MCVAKEFGVWEELNPGTIESHMSYYLITNTYYLLPTHAFHRLPG